MLAIHYFYSQSSKKNKTLRIEKSVKEVYVYDDENSRRIETIVQAPKTMTSFRTIPIPSSVICILNSVKNKNEIIFHDENINIFT